MKFDKENTWREYNELCLAPAILLYADRAGGFCGISFHFLTHKFMVSWREC